MGVLLTPLIVKETVSLRSLAGRRLAVDAHGELYQFLALIRQRDGVPLRSDYTVRFGEPDEDGVVRFLCEERAFGRERVLAALQRMRQRSLFD